MYNINTNNINSIYIYIYIYIYIRLFIIYKLYSLFIILLQQVDIAITEIIKIVYNARRVIYPRVFTIVYLLFAIYYIPIYPELSHAIDVRLIASNHYSGYSRGKDMSLE